MSKPRMEYTRMFNTQMDPSSGAFNRAENRPEEVSAGRRFTCDVPVENDAAVKRPDDVVLLTTFSSQDRDDFFSCSSRPVDGNWNNHIAERSEITDATTFKVTRSCVFKSWSALSRSNAPWIHLELVQLQSAKHTEWNFPKILNQSLKTLTVRECNFTWTWLMAVTGRFKALEKLTIVDSNISSNHQGTRVPKTYRKITKRSISLRLEMKSYRSLNSCLRLFGENIEYSPFTLTGLEVLFPAPQYIDGSSGLCLTPESSPQVQEFSKAFTSMVYSCGGTESVELLKEGPTQESSFECDNIFDDDNFVFFIQCLRSTLETRNQRLK